MNKKNVCIIFLFFNIFCAAIVIYGVELKYSMYSVMASMYIFFSSNPSNNYMLLQPYNVVITFPNVVAATQLCRPLCCCYGVISYASTTITYTYLYLLFQEQ